MKICIDIRPTQNAHKDSGIGRYAFNLITRLPIVDTENRYFYLFYNNADLPQIPKEVKDRVSFIPFNKKKPRIPDGKRWQEIIYKNNIDMIHILDIETPYPLPQNTKTVCTIHDLIPLIFPEFNYYKMDPLRKIRNKLRYSFFLKNIKKVDTIIAVSKNTKKDIIELLGIPPERIKVIYEGVDFHKFLVIKDDPDILKKYGIKQPYILHLGGLDKRKNILSLIAAYKNAGIFGHQLVIAGKSKKDMILIERKINELSLNDYIHLPGFIHDSDLPTIYKKASFYIYLSLYEGFGLPPLEAMAAGTPVLTSNASSILEIVGDSAIHVNPADIDEISSALINFVEKKIPIKSLIEKGKERAKSFIWEKTAIETMELYHSLIQY
ncbi:MAG: glycosyltransferase family 4 protein [bacterium]